MDMILDWKEYERTARRAAAEGIVMLENRNEVLPLRPGTTVSVFGRIALHYYRSGTGSGGLVNTDHVVGIQEALELEPDIKVNGELAETYRLWDAANPVDPGHGWGTEPWAQAEMPVTDELCKQAASTSDTAIVVIGRTAGEDRDNEDRPGAYRLTEVEHDMLRKVRAHFPQVIVLLNVGNIMDMTDICGNDPDAILYIWQGGMMGGLATVDVLTGRVNPCGKLTDTIASKITDYPSDRNFGGMERDLYQEDIYVGYRYFETMNRSAVLYPFGFGRSYTGFEIKCTNCSFDPQKLEGSVTVSVTNTGSRSGREVVQLYVQAPQGSLGKASRVLAGFAKTKELGPGHIDKVRIEFTRRELESYDDSGATGHRSAWVLEAGTYTLYVGSDVRSALPAGSFDIEENIVTERLEEALAPVCSFERLRADGTMEAVPQRTIDPRDRREAHLPAALVNDEAEWDTDTHKSTFIDVKNEKLSIDEFLCRLTEEDLCALVRGEGMGSLRVTPGTAAAFGAVTDRLGRLGLPAVCCDDGPSGMRLDCGDKAFSLPGGTLLACTFDPELNRKLYGFLGLEMRKNRVDNILGPGMNIHRHPLNGRNFEYFSEDPLVTGRIGSAQLQGLCDAGVTGTAKHFCGNNQETVRRSLDSVISERALREIYLRGFEIAVRDGSLQSIMTTYGRVNGYHTASSYDLTETILRQQWGFEGITMTDWWADMADWTHEDSRRSDFAAMVRARNDMYMVTPQGDGSENEDNLKQSLEDGSLTRGELERSARDICRFLLKTPAMERLCGEEPVIRVIGAPEGLGTTNSEAVQFLSVDGERVFPGKEIDTAAGSDYVFGVHFEELGMYEMRITAKSEAPDTAQMPVGVFFTAIPLGTLVWNGTGGEWVTRQIGYWATTRNAVFRLHFSQSGLVIREIHICKKEDSER